MMVKSKDNKRRSHIGRRSVPYLLILPVMAWLVLLTIFPFVKTLQYSFLGWVLTRPWHKPFVGIQNYASVLSFSNRIYWNTMRNTGIYVAVALAIELILGLWLATLVNRPIKAQKFFATALLIPMVISPVVVGLFFRAAFAPDFGLVNYFLKVMRLTPWIPQEGFLGRISTALLTVILVDVWSWTPFTFLIFFAGLKSLPNEPFEAAEIDGSSPSQRFWFVTLPLLKPALLVAILFRAMDAYRIFDVVWIMTKGGPGGATETLSVLIYKTAFYYWDIGISTAMSYIMLVIAITFSTVLIRSLYHRPA